MNHLKYLQCAWFHGLIRKASSGVADLYEVRWLQWSIDESDSSLSTANLRLLKLSVLDLSGSHITEDWEGWSSFRASKRLRALDLECCCNLRSAPDLSAFTKLKILNLSCCHQMEHLHPSIGKLKSLVSLNLSFCSNLNELPEEVGELEDLEELHIYWSGITQIPTSIHSLGKLKRLNASSCKSLRGIPSSIGDLQNLQHLDISFTKIRKLPNAIGRLKNLQTLETFSTPISGLSKSIQNLSSLQRLVLSGFDNLRSLPLLPSSLEYLSVSGQVLELPLLCSLTHLEELRLERCYLLEDIPYLPSRLWNLDMCLEVLSISSCNSIEILDLSKLQFLEKLVVESCRNLVEILGLDELECLKSISITDCISIKNLLCPESQWLKELNVLECFNLVEIQGHLDNAKLLESLDFRNCISLETLPDLTEYKKLKSLGIQGCEKLDLKSWM